jgi:hypothetical protein
MRFISWKNALIGYAAHIVPDFFTGGVKLLPPPAQPTTVSISTGGLTSAILGLFSAKSSLQAF